MPIMIQAQDSLVTCQSF